jgi:hypothetical protein
MSECWALKDTSIIALAQIHSIFLGLDEVSGGNKVRENKDGKSGAKKHEVTLMM